jgi:chromosome segregation ATPase
MTDAPRPDLTAADWAAMRKHEVERTILDRGWPTYTEEVLLLALDALARLTAENARLKEDGADHKGAEIADVHAEILHRAEQAEAALADRDATIARLTAALTAAQFDRDEAVKDFLFGVHHDCRPNRKQAESWRDQLRDETDRHADTKAALADRDATIARLRSFLTLEKGRYQAELDAGVVSGTFLHRIRGKRDMCGEALAQLPLTPAKEADRG